MSGHRRFFVNTEQIDGETVTLEGGAVRQISKVLRLKEGDHICLLDGTGYEYDASISSLSKDTVKAVVVNKGACLNEPHFRLTLAICHPKGDKLELIVQKVTELGISRIVIVDSERTVARPEESKVADRLARWRRVASEATEQCGRSVVPDICGIVKYTDVIESIKNYPLALVAWEDEDETPLSKVLRENAGVESAILLIGPEGGLTEREIEDARAAGAKCVSFGRRVLRTETAAVAGCAAVMYELEGEL